MTSREERELEIEVKSSRLCLRLDRKSVVITLIIES